MPRSAPFSIALWPGPPYRGLWIESQALDPPGAGTSNRSSGGCFSYAIFTSIEHASFPVGGHDRLDDLSSGPVYRAPVVARGHSTKEIRYDVASNERWCGPGGTPLRQRLHVLQELLSPDVPGPVCGASGAGLLCSGGSRSLRRGAHGSAGSGLQSGASSSALPSLSQFWCLETGERRYQAGTRAFLYP